MPKGMDLSAFSLDELDAPFQLNTRPRKRLDSKPPLEVFTDLIKRAQEAPSGAPINPNVGLVVEDRCSSGVRKR